MKDFLQAKVELLAAVLDLARPVVFVQDLLAALEKAILEENIDLVDSPMVLGMELMEVPVLVV